VNDRPDFVYTDAQGLADGGQIDLTRLERWNLGGQVAFKGKPVNRMTDSVILALALRLTLDAKDTAEEGEPSGELYQVGSRLLGDAVLIQSNGEGGWTVMLASDY
jgi:hypothetical protein